ncbi:hypothetical protein OG258_49315 [Streptomyces mirabilis]|uniref:hypothetical protein n=1 Tax=Streptomyces mirabilis TaxID=68239 RepID=UPI002E2C36FB|nr:hypothetical protein [Streptomyces mirabilis]
MTIDAATATAITTTMAMMIARSVPVGIGQDPLTSTPDIRICINYRFFVIETRNRDESPAGVPAVQQATRRLAQIDQWIAVEEQRRGKARRPPPPEWLLERGIGDEHPAPPVHRGGCH